MADNPIDVADLAGFLKPVFGELQMLIPEEALCQRLWPFSGANMVGDHFEEPVLTKPTWSVTYCGSDGSTATLVDALPANTQKASVYPFLTVLRTQVSYSLFDRSAEAGKKAFMSMGAFAGKELTMQLRRLTEISMLCGQDSIFAVESYDGTSTEEKTTITAASLRPGILAMLEGAQVVFFTSTGLTRRAIATSGGAALTVALPSGGSGSIVDVDNRTFKIDGAPSSDPQAGDLVYIRTSNNSDAGTADFKEMVGLRKQASATSGTVLGLDKAAYTQWRGNTASSVGPMNAGNLLTVVTKGINRGLQGRAVAILSPKRWNALNSQIISSQVFDQSYKPSKASEGVDSIEVRGQGVVVECYPHSYQSDGEVLVVPKEYVKRVGSAMEGSGGEGGDRDISFAIPGSTAKYLQPIVGKTAVEMQCRTDQQIYCPRPAWMVLGTGVTD